MENGSSGTLVGPSPGFRECKDQGGCQDPPPSERGVARPWMGCPCLKEGKRQGPRRGEYCARPLRQRDSAPAMNESRILRMGQVDACNDDLPQYSPRRHFRHATRVVFPIALSDGTGRAGIPVWTTRVRRPRPDARRGEQGGRKTETGHGLSAVARRAGEVRGGTAPRGGKARFRACPARPFLRWLTLPRRSGARAPPRRGGQSICTRKDNRSEGIWTISVPNVGCGVCTHRAHLSADFRNRPVQSLLGEHRRGFLRARKVWKRMHKRKRSAHPFSACAREAILQSCTLPPDGRHGAPSPRHARPRQTSRFAPANPSVLGNLVNFRFGRWLRGARTRASPLISETGKTRASQENQRRGFSGPGRVPPPQKGPERTRGR